MLSGSLRKLVTVSLLCAAVSARAENTRLLRFPDIHRGLIVFSYAGDLWLVSDQGGLARQLTAGETRLDWYPKFSADGERIAYSSDPDGAPDVYVIPTAGGEPMQVTYHPARDRVLDWTPDGRILFQSRRGGVKPNLPRLFTIPPAGGLPEALPMPTGGSACYSPDGTRIAYNPTDTDHRTWKRYRGGLAEDIWIYDVKAQRTTRLTTFEGTDGFPMWEGERIYFLSDRDRTANLYVHDLATGQERRLTFHDEYDVKWPSLGPGQIVYENGGTLWVLDLATERAREVPITVPTDGLSVRPRWLNVADRLDSLSLSPSGKRAALGARGEVFTAPEKKGDVRNLTRTSGVRESEPAWSPDGKWIAYLSDRTGEKELWVRPADGSGTERQVTRGGTVYRQGLAWSPDSQKIAFADKDQVLYFARVADGTITRVDRADSADITDFAWSPDSRWLAYAKRGKNRLGSIYLYSLDTGRVTPVTAPVTDDFDPVFDPKGRYLYFLSNRDMKPFMDVTDVEYILQGVTRPYAVTLARDAESPFAPESDEEGKKDEVDDEKKDEESKDKKDGEKKDRKEPPAKPIRIDLDGIAERVVAFPVSSGNLSQLAASEDAVFFIDAPPLPLSGTWEEPHRDFVLKRYSLKDRELKTVLSGVWGYSLSADGKKILYASEQEIGIVESSVTDKKAGEGKIDLSGMVMRLDPREEWRQIFFESWRLERDFFYDPGMHGQDWGKIRDRYARLLPHVACREDLNYLLGEMIGELVASHTYIFGGDQPRFGGVDVGLLGADFELDAASGRYRFARVLPPDPWNLAGDAPLAQPGREVREGEYLLAVDGHDLRAPESPYRPFQETTGRQVVLTVGKSPDGKDSRTVIVVPVADESGLRYAAWVQANREKVLRATGGRVGYIHLPDMSGAGLREFSKHFAAQIDKGGLVMDVRFNGGGFVSEIILERLRRELAGMFSARNSQEGTYPWQVIHGPMVCIINEFAGSDGDIFPHFFRHYGLGKLVGKRTWGGVVGIRLDKRLIDGGMLTMPEYGTYSLDRRWIIENRGVPPDVEVDLLAEDVLAGRDPQLDAAIRIILEELAARPGGLPPVPDHFPRPDEGRHE